MIRRGQIYFVNLDPTLGREQAGRRPVVVVSANSINRQPLVVTVVVGTSARNLSRKYATNVHVPAEESGLPADTAFLCFQIRSLDPDRLVDPRAGAPKPAGTMPADRMIEIDQALKLALDLS